MSCSGESNGSDKAFKSKESNLNVKKSATDQSYKDSDEDQETWKREVDETNQAI